MLLARHVHEKVLMHAGGINHTHAKLNLIAFIPNARELWSRKFFLNALSARRSSPDL